MMASVAACGSRDIQTYPQSWRSIRMAEHARKQFSCEDLNPSVLRLASYRVFALPQTTRQMRQGREHAKQRNLTFGRELA